MTREEFERLTNEYLACERFLGDPWGKSDEETKSLVAQACARQLEICRMQDACPYEYDEDNNIILKPGRTDNDTD